MRLLVGPVAPECAAVWTEWTLEAIEELRAQGASAGPLPPETLDAIDSYARAWAQAPHRGKVFRWQSDVDPDQLEYVTNALYNLDGHVAAQVTRGRRPAAPVEVEAFQRVLVHALLHALAEVGPCRAAFSEHLAQTWPALRHPT